MFFFSFTVQWLFLKAMQTPTILRLVKRLDINLHLDQQRMKHAIKSKIVNIKHTLVFIHTFKNTTDLSKSFFVNNSLTKARSLPLYCFIPANPCVGRRTKKIHFEAWHFRFNFPTPSGKVQIAHPREGLTRQIPYPRPDTENSKMPRVCPGGDVEVSNWSAHYLGTFNISL